MAFVPSCDDDAVTQHGSDDMEGFDIESDLGTLCAGKIERWDGDSLRLRCVVALMIDDAEVNDNCSGLRILLLPSGPVLALPR